MPASNTGADWIETAAMLPSGVIVHVIPEAEHVIVAAVYTIVERVHVVVRIAYGVIQEANAVACVVYERPRGVHGKG